MRRLLDNPYLLLVLTTLMWGANSVAGKLAVGEVSPMTLTCLRWVIVCVGLFAIFGRGLVRDLPLLAPHALRILLMGASGFTIFNSLYYAAAYKTTGINMSLIQGSIPIFVLIGAVMLFGQRVRPLQILGMIVTIAGVLVISSHGDIRQLATLSFNGGDVYILIASLFYAGYTLSLRTRPRLPAIAFFFGLALGALATSLPVIAGEIALGLAHAPSPKGWAILLFIAICPSLLAQMMYIRAVTLIGPGRAGIFVNLVPVFGAMLSVLILGEPFGLYHAIALALVLGGIWLAERRGSVSG